MVRTYARWVTRRPVSWAIVILTLLVGVFSGVYGIEVEQDDDVLAFLPDTNQEIRAFKDISRTFASTDVALVGLDPDDPFSPEFLTQLDALTEALRDMKGLDSALTLTNVGDFEPDPETGGIITAPLVRTVPTTADESAALRDKVMSRDHIVGTLISHDADAVVLYAFLQPDQQPRVIAQKIRDAVEVHFPDTPTYWGGAPFIGTWIYETTQADMAALTPWSVIAILFIMMVAFRDALGTVLGLVATGLGIAVSRAAMNVLGVSFNIVLSSMPVILFAVGSAYAIHMLSQYNTHAREVGPTAEAVERTIVATGPTVLAAGLTTVAGLLSFVTMDIGPMQTFGVFTALGIFSALLASLMFVPAVMALFPRPIRSGTSSFLLPITVAIAHGTRHRRAVAGVLTLAVLGIGSVFAGQVESRMDLAAFFDDDSEPAHGEAFLERRFGGSQFLQIRVEANHDDPIVLRQVQQLGDRLRVLPHVSGVTTIADPMGLIHEAMEGTRRLPDTSRQAAALFRFLDSDPSIAHLVTEDRQASLMQVKIDTSDSTALRELLDTVETLVASHAPTRWTSVPRDTAAHPTFLERASLRIASLVRHHGGPPTPVSAEAIMTALGAPPAPEASSDVASRVRSYFGSEECWVIVPEPLRAPIAATLSAGGPEASTDDLRQRLAGLDTAAQSDIDADMLFDEVLMAVEGELQSAWRNVLALSQAQQLLAQLDIALPSEDHRHRLQRDVAAVFQEAGSPTLIGPADASTPPEELATATWTVSGTPVLYRGLSRSVTANQFKSLGTALGLIFLIMTLYYRSPLTGLLATLPTGATLVVVYAVMGALDIHLDIGTSMLASIILGAGVDYAVHLLAAWDPRGGSATDAARHAVEETSHGIWTNAVMVAAGFFVLTLGDAKPLRNVGLLTSSAMLIAALSTFSLIPLLAAARAYRTPPELD
ncbi:MAG: efflux RND transporter permease subunit [Myxococcota bacterium]